MGIQGDQVPVGMTTPKPVIRKSSANFYGVVDFHDLKIKRVIKCVERTSSIDYFVS